MTIRCYRPQFSDDFKQKAKISARKGSKVYIAAKKDVIVATCHAWNRVVGTLAVVREGDTARLLNMHIIEKDYYPKEAMLIKLVSSLRRRKIKTLEM